MDRYGGPELTRIVDPDGRVAATVTPAGSVLTPLWKAVRLDEKVREHDSQAWAKRGGNVPANTRAVVTLADGTEVRIRHGSLVGPHRRAQGVRATVAGRRYRFVHTSGTTAEVERDGELIVRANSSGSRRRPPDAVPAAFTRGVDLAIRAPLDRIDELVVVLFAELFGPPGRGGLLRAIADVGWDTIRNP